MSHTATRNARYLEHRFKAQARANHERKITLMITREELQQIASLGLTVEGAEFLPIPRLTRC